MASTLTDEEEGKTVVDASGEPLGLITTVEEDAAYVEPNPDLAESIAARLGGKDAEDDEYAIHADAVNETTDEKIRLREEL